MASAWRDWRGNWAVNALDPLVASLTKWYNEARWVVGKGEGAVVSVHELLEVAIRERASDVLVKAGGPPALRVDGLVRPSSLEPLSAEDTEELARSIIYTASRDYLLQFHGTGPELKELEVAEDRMKELSEQEEIDLVFTIPNLVRVRANLFLQRSSVATALRIIPLKPFSLEDLGLPAVLNDLSLLPQGLILVTGPTGSGKSTTLAAMVDWINANRSANVVTIEDPIEYVFEDKKSVVYQREVGRDTRSFAAALRSVLRQTPDVIMIGEMRDAETMSVAMLAAEMGHLVLSTLHTNSAGSTIDRIVNSFPPHERATVRSQLGGSLVGVVSQRLIRKLDASGRVVAVEVMTTSPTVRKQIEEGNATELYAAIRDGHHFGMITMNQSLERLYQSKQISYEDALANAGNLTELRHMLRRS
jgi:twitching motility protein PilT